jgi:hypothetical protein
MGEVNEHTAGKLAGRFVLFAGNEPIREGLYPAGEPESDHHGWIRVALQFRHRVKKGVCRPGRLTEYPYGS